MTPTDTDRRAPAGTALATLWSVPVAAITVLGLFVWVADHGFSLLPRQTRVLVDQHLALSSEVSDLGERFQVVNAGHFALLARVGLGQRPIETALEVTALVGRLDQIIADLENARDRLSPTAAAPAIAAAMTDLRAYRQMIVPAGSVVTGDVQATINQLDRTAALAARVESSLEAGRLRVLDAARDRLAEVTETARAAQRTILALIAFGAAVALMIFWRFGRLRHQEALNRDVLDRMVDARTRELQNAAVALSTSNAHYLSAKEDAERHLMELRQTEAQLRATTDGLRERVAHLEGAQAVLEDQRSSLSGLARQLERARDAAEAASRAKSDFLATMSHEIRTPLNGVIGMAGLLADSEMAADQRMMVETIRQSGEALLSVINDILDFSKIEAGKMEIEMSAFDLLSVIEQTAEIVTARAQAKNLDLATHVPVALEGYYAGDAGRIRQVLLNLLVNAVKFTNRGTIRLEVEAEPGQNALRFTVHDTGIGIAEEDLPRLFAQFTQLDSSPARRYGGTGLGLAISRRLVEMMGGTIGLHSSRGQGSSFWFILPLTRVERAQPPVLPRAPGDRRPSVVVIEPDTILRATLVQTLSNWSCTVAAATTAAEGDGLVRDAAAAGRPFDCVLVEHRLPDQPGLALARTWRQNGATAGLKVVLISRAGLLPADETPDWPQAVDARLNKPIRQSALRDTMIAVLAGDQARAAASMPAAAFSVHSERRLRILIAEDNPVNQQVIVTMVRKLGHHGDVAGDGAEAVQAIKNFPYDLVLMDIQMPTMDGIEATRVIRSLGTERAGIPVVAVTANAFSSDRDRCLAAGLTDYIAKPIQIAALSSILDRLAGQHSVGARPASASPADDDDLASANRDVIEQLKEAFGECGVQDLLATYQRTSQETLEQMASAVAAGDLRSVQRAAHSLRGASAQLLQRALADLAHDIEQHAVAGQVAGLDQKIRILHDRFHKTISSLNAL